MNEKGETWKARALVLGGYVPDDVEQIGNLTLEKKDDGQCYAQVKIEAADRKEAREKAEQELRLSVDILALGTRTNHTLGSDLIVEGASGGVIVNSQPNYIPGVETLRPQQIEEVRKIKAVFDPLGDTDKDKKMRQSLRYFNKGLLPDPIWRPEALLNLVKSIECLFNGTVTDELGNDVKNKVKEDVNEWDFVKDENQRSRLIQAIIEVFEEKTTKKKIKELCRAASLDESPIDEIVDLKNKVAHPPRKALEVDWSKKEESIYAKCKDIAAELILYRLKNPKSASPN